MRASRILQYLLMSCMKLLFLVTVIALVYLLVATYIKLNWHHQLQSMFFKSNHELIVPIGVPPMQIFMTALIWSVCVFVQPALMHLSHLSTMLLTWDPLNFYCWFGNSNYLSSSYDINIFYKPLHSAVTKLGTSIVLLDDNFCYYLACLCCSWISLIY